MKYRLLACCLVMVFACQAQIPTDYYTAANNKKGTALRSALHTIIKNHTTLTYSDLWDAFYTTDVRPDNGKVWDIYSDNPDDGANYYFDFGSDQCGNYSGEGDCYNREHSVPKSWFGDAAPMYTDLFHLYPTDGFVNGKRGNLAFGEVNNANWTSSNGSKLGSSAVAGSPNTVFEPIDAYKGDLARTYFYFSVCYKDKNLGVEDHSMFSGGNLKPWALAMLIQWHNDDPVSQKELDRNNAVYDIQGNRNPFIDFPELVGKIYGSDSINAFNPTNIEEFELSERWQIYPNPANDAVTITPPVTTDQPATLQLLSLTGQLLRQEEITLSDSYRLNLAELTPGVYLLRIQSDQFRIIKKIVKN